MIRLEPFTPADFNQLIEWINDERLMKEWSGSLFSFPLTEESLAWYLEGANDFTKPEVFVYKAIDSKTEAVVGHISLGSISQKDNSGRITRVLVGSISQKDNSGRITRVLVGSQAERGKGVCSKMIKALLRVGFEELKLHRISLGVYTFNEAAIRCYRKAGMQQEGIMRDVARHGDEYWSLMEMGMLEDEWRALQKPATGPDIQGCC